ncbi:hypothetical protein PSAB6_360045 [Paraburkholderia sabiae]|nr:hypothetical protein PSAB6_360045 [Paraburkholderia sabiae]
MLTECAPSGCHFSRRAWLTAGFLRSVGVAVRRLKERVPWRYPGRHRRFKSGFLWLLSLPRQRK